MGGGLGECSHKKNLKSRSSEMQFPAFLGIKNRAAYVAFKNYNFVVVVEFVEFFIDIFFYFHYRGR